MTVLRGGSLSSASPSAVPPLKGPWLLAADVGLLGLGLALALSSSRLFQEASSTIALVAVALIAWALAAALRRSPLRPGLGELVQLAIGFAAATAVALVAVAARPAAAAGEGVLEGIVRIMREDFAGFSTDVAPVPAGLGHLLLMGTLIWLLADFASYASIRLRSPVQGAVPHVVAIVGLGLLAREQARMLTTLVLLVALAVYALTQAAWRNAALRWTPRPRQGVAAPMRSGAILLAVAAVAALATSPLLPGDSDPVIDFRNGGAGDGPRNVVSPFVEVGSNLGVRSDQLLFTVEAERASYWRLTALDEYDPESDIWVLSNSYEPVDGPLSSTVVEQPGSAEVTIRALGGFWVPTVPDPLTARSERSLGWDPEAGSLIVRGQDLSADEVIAMTADPAQPDREELSRATVPPAGGTDPTLLDIEGLPVQLRVAAREVAGDQAPYETALALQNWLRSEFTYDQSVDLSDSADPLVDFLELRRGFCQQFASAFALAARSLGLPARVVVGFTSGDLVEPDKGIYAVRGRHAHAWPEVLFEGLGWVAFEPTPGRGDPSTTATTGVDGANAPAPDGSTEVQEPAPTTSVAPPPSSASATSLPGGAKRELRSSSRIDEQQGSRLPLAAALAAAVALAVALGALWRRSRRGTGRRPGEGGLLAAWQTSLALLADRGLRPTQQETPMEFAGRVRTRLGTTAMVDLARVESKRRWAPTVPGHDDLATALCAVSALQQFLQDGPAP